MTNFSGELIIVTLNFIVTLLLSHGLNNLQYDVIKDKLEDWNIINNPIKKNKIYVRNGNIKSNIYFFLATCVYVVSLSFREIAENHIGGNDAITMYKTFLRAKEYDFFTFWPGVSYREFGYSLITWIWSNSTYDYRLLLALQYALSIILFIKYLKNIKYKVKNIDSFLFLGLGVCYLLYEINLQRNCIAIFIVLNIYNLLLEKKYKSACLLTILGTQIHLSAIVLLPLIIIMYMYKEKMVSSKVLLIVEISCMVVTTLIIPILLYTVPFLKQYSSYYISGFNGIKQPIIIIIGAIILSKTNSVKKENQGLIIVLYYSIIVFAFSFYISMAYRMIFYFMPVAFILFGQMTYKGMELFQLKKCIYMAYSKMLIIYGYLMFYTNYYKTGGVYNFFFR